MKRIVLIYGVIAGAIVGGLMFATWPLHENGTINFDNGMLVGYTTMVIALSLIFFGVKSYRDNQQGGVITFGTGLKIGLLITLVASIMYSLSWEVLANTVAQDFGQKWADYSIQNMVKNGASEAEIAKAKEEMAGFMEMYKNPIIRFGMTLTEILPVGILVSLISAALLRRKEFLSRPSAS